MTQPTHGCPAELRDALNSPVPSVRTPFTPEGHIDFDGVRSQVDFLIAGRARVLMLTSGDSLHSVLTDDEVADLARAVIEHARGRAKVIAADNNWATRKAVAYAEYCKQIGADLLMLSPPDWAASTTPQTLVEHFNAVGEHMPTMLVTAFFSASGVLGTRTASFRPELTQALYERAPNQVAVKDDLMGEAGIRMCTTTHGRWAYVTGGWMSNHLTQVPYGAEGYLCTFMNCWPEISWQYFDAIQDRDFPAAWRIVREIEQPLRDLMYAFEGGFNAVVHGMSELLGISSRHLPPPYHTMTDEQMERLTDGLRSMNLL